jgi:hypothetical protein
MARIVAIDPRDYGIYLTAHSHTCYD